MKISVKVAELSKKLQRGNEVIPSKPAIPTDEWFKLEVTAADRAELTATDVGASIVQDLAIKLISDDYETILLPAAKLLEIVGKLPSETELFITSDGAKPLALSATSPKYKATLPSKDATDYRQIAIPAANQAITKLKSKSVISLIDRVSVAAPTKDQKNVTASLLFEGDGKILVAVATDGFRIAIANALESAIGEPISIQVPKTVVGLLKNVAGDEIVFTQSETNLFFKTPTELVVISKPISKFPPYKTVLAAMKFETITSIAVPIISNAIGLANVTSDQKKPSVYIDFTATGITISSLSEEGETVTDIDATTQGNPNRVRLNQAFVNDFLGNVEGTVAIASKDARSFVKFSASADYEYFIMPLLLESKKAAAPTA